MQCGGLTYITHSQRSALLPNDELNGDLWLMEVQGQKV